MILRVALRRSSSLQPAVLMFDDLQLPDRKITFFLDNEYLKDIFLNPRKVTNRRRIQFSFLLAQTHIK